MPVNPGDVIAGKYRIAGLVAVGGMGIIVSAEHLQLGHQVAIKVLLPSEAAGESQAIPRFLREARAAAGIHSDHVVRIYDVDTLPDGLPYMVMELLAGFDLRRIVRTQGPLPVGEAVDCVLQAADAIGQAHALGIVHRDLKPSNLFMTTRSDGRTCVKVLDFGISKASHDQLVDGALTTSRAMIGSPMYMSPEQIRDAKSVDARSDIWSLGVILHELLTGKPAFRGESLPAICAAIAADEPPLVTSVRPDVPAELQAIVDRCLHKDPALRFPNVEELVRALEPFATDDTASAPVHSAPLSARYLQVGAASLPSPRPQQVSDPSVAGQTVAFPLQAPVRSEEPPLTATAPSVALPARSRLRLALAVLASLLALALLAAIGVGLSRSKPASGPVSTSPVARGFALYVESEPTGAELFEGDRVLGRTPLQLFVDAQSVQERPRSFVLKLPGRRPYAFEQGPSPGDVRVRPTLIDEPEAPPLASTADCKSAKPPTRPKAPGKTDIRLQR